MAYRPDIDGLRAIAVVAVVLFHAFPEAFPGGFVGVDVFFVISGYLITGIIRSEMANGTFSIAKFYSRRIRRIFPALSVVLLSTLLIGWVALMPAELEALGRHVAAGAGFVANIQFWKEAGYFDTAADLKPTLHLWSLGVEEQFYIVWPILLTIGVRRGIALPRLVLVLVAVSFTVNVLTVERHGVAAFFLPSSRFWELLVGALLAVSPPRQSEPTRSCRSFLLPWFGMAFLAGAFFLIDKTRHFPGWWALLPTLSTATLIYAGPAQWINHRLLGSAPVAFVGLISYPLYLWHWPLLALVRVVENGDPDTRLIIAALIISVLLSFVTYRYVEAVLRHRRQPWVVPFLLTVMFAVGIGGYSVYRNHGVPDRLDNYLERTKANQEDLRDFEAYRADVVRCDVQESFAKSLSWCLKGREGKAGAVLWGDSHADHLFPGIVSRDVRRNWLFFGTSSCPPLNGVKAFARGTDDQICHDNNVAILRWIVSSPEIKVVVLASLGPYYISDIGYAPQHRGELSPSNFVMAGERGGDTDKRSIFLSGMMDVVRQLLAAGKQVVLFEDIPELPFMPEKCIGRPVAFRQPSCSVARESVDLRRSEYKSLLKEIQTRYPSVAIYSPEAVLCDSVQCGGMVDGILMYRDSHHLSRRGSNYIGEGFIGWLDR